MGEGKFKRGLSAEYKNINSGKGALLKNLIGFAFLDPVDIVQCFVKEIKPIQPEAERVLRIYLEYIEN